MKGTLGLKSRASVAKPTSVGSPQPRGGGGVAAGRRWKPPFHWLGIFLCLLLLLAAAACALPGSAGLAPAPTPSLSPSPRPIALPADDAPHDNLTEWWYYTGHLAATTGERYGFELVFFQSRRGDIPTAYAAHFAITDRGRGRFQHAEKSFLGALPATTRGFDLGIDDWRMQGADGRDHLRAGMPGYAIDLTVESKKPAALQHGIGWLSFGPAGDSYYYSRTRLAVRGTVVEGDEVRQVSGDAWFDHQWGDFISVAGGGWDWFGLQLDAGSELMLSLVRDLDGKPAVAYGTYVDPAGTASNLDPHDFTVKPTGAWRGPKTGITYPSGWKLAVPGHDLDLTLTPVLVDQELDTRATTGVAYWEGEVEVRNSDQQLAGLGYVELTGYGE